MPPNAGDIAFEDLESTFDTTAFINPKFFLTAQQTTVQSDAHNVEPKFNIPININDEKINFGYSDVHDTISTLIPSIRQFNPDAIIGINGGGQIVSQIINASVSVPVLPVSLKLCPDITTGLKVAKVMQWFDDSSEWAQRAINGRLMIVADMDDTRQIIEFVVTELIERYHPSALATAALHEKKTVKIGVLPSFVECCFTGRRVPDVEICYPWNTPTCFDSSNFHEAKEKKVEVEVSASKSDREQLVKQMLDEEEAIKCLCIDDIESRLIEDGKRRACEGKIEESEKENEEIVNYWDWNEADLFKVDPDSETKNNAADYWQWNTPAEEKKAEVEASESNSDREKLVKQLLKEEEAIKSLLVDDIESRLIEDGKRRACEGKIEESEKENEEDVNYWDWDGATEPEADHDSETKDNANDYWQWNTPDDNIPTTTTLSTKVDKDEFIKKILLEEELRQFFMVDKIEKRLIGESNMRREDTVEYECADENDSAESETYWYWGESSDNGKYEGEIRLDLKVDSIEKRLVAESQKRLSSLPESDLKYNSESMKYWEWKDDCKPIDAFREEMNKDELLRKILLEDEIRRSLMVENIEINLGKEAKRQQEECKEYEISLSDSCNDYWGW